MEPGKPFSATDSPLVDFDAVCQKVRAAVEPARAHAVSLHDHHGDVLWLSESSMGPDEHNAVREALEAFQSSNGPSVLAYDLGDSRSAMLLRAVNARHTLVGAIMVIMDTRAIKQDSRGSVKMMTPKLQRVLSDFAAMRPEVEPSPEVSRTPPAAPSAKPAANLIAKPAALASVKGPVGKTAPAAPRPAPAQAATSKHSPTPPARNPPPAPRAAPTQAMTSKHSFTPPVRSPAAPLATTHPASARPAAARSTPPTAAPLRQPPAPGPPARSSTSNAHVNGSASSGSSMEPIELSLVDSVRVTAVKPQATLEPQPTAPPHSLAAPGKRAAEKRTTEPPVTPEIDRLHAALRRSPIALHVQRLVPLTKGSQLKRYEVLLRAKGDDAPNSAPHAMLKTAVDNGLGSMIDRRVVTELIGWLVHHPDVWQTNAVMFSVNLTATALHDEHFMKFVGLCLAKSSLPTAMIAFEVDVPTAIKLSERVSEVAAALHRLGCPMVLDDFALRTECFALLRLPGVRYIKLAPEITAQMRTDKLAQAAITAVVQMARVLGMHTVAKRTETSAEQEWLTALGVDFIQSHALSPPAAIESLSKGTKAKT